METTLQDEGISVHAAHSDDEPKGSTQNPLRSKPLFFVCVQSAANSSLEKMIGRRTRITPTPNFIIALKINQLTTFAPIPQFVSLRRPAKVRSHKESSQNWCWRYPEK
jgi:hypothetical protein